jgi:hypothetical protein
MLGGVYPENTKMFKYLKISQCNSWYQQTNGEKL